MIEPWLPEPEEAEVPLRPRAPLEPYGLPPTRAVGRLPRPSDPSAWGLRFVVLSVVLWGFAPVLGFVTVMKAFVIIGFVAAVAGLFMPTIGILGVGLLVALDPLTRVYLLEGGLWRWNTFNYWLLAVIALSTRFLLKERSTSFRLVVLLAAWLVFGLAWSSDTTEGLQHLLGLLAFFGLFAYFERLGDSPEDWCWLGLVVGTCAATGCLVFYVWRVEMPTIDPNAWIFFPLSGMFATSLALPFAGARSWFARALLMLGAINFVWVFLSGSRGGLLMAGCCAFLWVAGARGLHRKLAYAAGVAVFAGFVLIAFDGLREAAWSRVEKLFDEDQSLALRTSGRSDLAIAGWRIFLDHPVLGVGTGGFGSHWINLRNDQGLSGYGRGRLVDAHAGWVKTLAEGGLVGLLLQASLVGSFAAAGWRARGVKRNLGILVTVILSVAFLTTEFQGKGLWFLAAGVLTILRSRTRAPAPGPVRLGPTGPGAIGSGESPGTT